MHRRPVLPTLLAIVALLLAACGGSADLGTESASSDGGAQDTSDGDGNASGSDDGGGAPAAGGPINGPLYVTGSFGLGMFVIDGESGDVRELETDVVEVVDRNTNPVVTETAAFTIGGVKRPDSDFANDLFLVRLDLATGEFTSLAELGFDRENDDATTFNSHEMIGAGGNSVFVSVRDGAADTTTWHHFDATTGAELASFPEPTYEFEDDTGTCSGGTTAFDTDVTPDGRLVTFIGGLPGEIDPMTGVIAALPGSGLCGELDLNLADYVTPAEMDAFSVYRDGVPVEWAGLDAFFWPDISGGFAVRGGFVLGDGDYWWVFAGSQSTENFEELTPADALVGGVVQWDPDTGSVVQVLPLGPYSGEYIGETDDGGLEIARPNFDLAFADGLLVMVDRNEDAPTLILDPTSGAITELNYELGDGIDFVEAELQPTRAGEVWVRIRRAVITSEEDGGRSSTGQLYSERIDPTTGTVTASHEWAGF